MCLESDPGGSQVVPVSPSCLRYTIRVQGHLDAHWSEWLDGMTITHEEDGITRLQGPVIDQAALHGLLEKLRDLRLPIVTHLGGRVELAYSHYDATVDLPQENVYALHVGLSGFTR